MKTGISPLSRHDERKALLGAIRQGTIALMFPAKGYCVSGDLDVGKTWLLQQVDRESAGIERAIRLHGDLDRKWDALDPLERLVGLRNLVANSTSRFDPAAFDLVLPVFLAKFRPGYGFQVTTRETAEPALVEETLRDIAKKVLESTVGEWANTAATAGGSAAVVGAAKAVVVGGAVASASTILVPAATVGAITFATASGAVACKYLIRAVRRKARRRGLFRRYDRLAGFLSSDRPDHDDFFNFLAYLLGDAVNRMRDRRVGYLPVLFLDPADALADDPEGAAAQVGIMLTQVFKHAGRQLVIATSRKPLELWHKAIETAGTAPSLSYEEIHLDYIGLEEAGRSARESGYKGDWPAAGISVLGNNRVRPKELADWWRNLGDPPLAQSENV